MKTCRHEPLLIELAKAWRDQKDAVAYLNNRPKVKTKDWKAFDVTWIFHQDLEAKRNRTSALLDALEWNYLRPKKKKKG
jgi:hypothetical protein